MQAGANLGERRRKGKLDRAEIFAAAGGARRSALARPTAQNCRRLQHSGYLCDGGLPDGSLRSARSAQAIQASAISNRTALSFAALFSASRRHSAAYWRYFSASFIAFTKIVSWSKCLKVERGTFCSSSASNPRAPLGTKSMSRVFTSGGAGGNRE